MKQALCHLITIALKRHVAGYPHAHAFAFPAGRTVLRSTRADRRITLGFPCEEYRLGIFGCVNRFHPQISLGQTL